MVEGELGVEMRDLAQAALTAWSARPSGRGLRVTGRGASETEARRGRARPKGRERREAGGRSPGLARSRCRTS